MAEGLKTTLERERKLAVPAGWKLPEIPGEELEAAVFTSTYFDTAERRLARFGVTLRRRVQNGKGVWQLKLPRPEGRLELEAPGGPKGPPRKIADLASPFVRGEKLERIATLRTRRHGVRVSENGTTLADVVHDEVSVLEGRRVAERFAEVEIESIEGDGDDLDRLEADLRKAGALPSNGRPKAFRRLDLSEPQHPPFTEEAEQVRRAIAAQYEQMLAHDAGVRLDAGAEDVHRFRVATRRLRTILRAARPLTDATWADGLRDELKWLADSLGPVRDADVLLGHLESQLESLDGDERTAAAGLVRAIAAGRSRARNDVLEALKSERYRRLLDDLEEASRAPKLVAADTSLQEIAAKEFDRLAAAARKARNGASDEALHRLRIRGKRARYAAELVEPLAGKAVSRFLERAKHFQDVVGEHQDAVVAEERIRAFSKRGQPGAAFAAGRLAERERARRERARAELKPAWRRLEKAGRRAFE